MILDHTIKDRLVCNSAKLKTALLDCERLKKPVTFYTRERRYIDSFRCIDTELKPFTLDNFVCHGGLIYYKKDSYNWVTFSIDDILKIKF